MTDQNSVTRSRKMRTTMTGIDLAVRSQRHKLIAAESRQRLIGLAQRKKDRAAFFPRAAIVPLRRISM